MVFNDILYFIGSACIQLTIYTLSREHLNTKQRAWVILLVAAVPLVLLSLPILVKLFTSLGNNTYKEYFNDLLNNESSIHRIALIWFTMALFLDCVIGMVDYVEDFDLTHHIFYIINGFFTLYHKGASLGFVLTPMEIPSLIFSIGKIFPSLKSNWLFGSTLFFFRLVYEVLIYIYLMATPEMPKMFISMIFGLTLPMHLRWCYKWSKKFFK